MRVPKIALDATEDALRGILVSFSKEYSSDLGKSVTLRITGGWVRDKLLGHTSHDIDIAIDCSTGEQFAVALQKYLASSGQGSHSVHKIARNPEKSKHLETATTKLLGLDVDFVNLRSEEYAGDSRVPKMGFGTPYEDAMRRDATLNALFYNLEKKEIEDFTGHGLEDLESGVLRTPLDPYVTFEDDPLRVLRLIRFASRFNFSLAENAQNAMESPAIKNALRAKVSRERVGIEMQKMVEAEFAEKGLHYFVALGLAPSVFTVPPEYRDVSLDWQKLPENFQAALAVLPKLEFLNTRKVDGRLWLAILLSETAGQVTVDRKGKEAPVSLVLVRDGIKLPKTVAATVSRMLELAPMILFAADTGGRTQVGQIVRKCGPEWSLFLGFAACVYRAPKKMALLHDTILGMDLQEAWDIKPVINGRVIKSLFPEKPSGPWIKDAEEALIEKQFAQPSLNKSEAEQFVKNFVLAN